MKQANENKPTQNEKLGTVPLWRNQSAISGSVGMDAKQDGLENIRNISSDGRRRRRSCIDFSLGLVRSYSKRISIARLSRGCMCVWCEYTSTASIF